MPSIPASAIVQINPGVISSGGNPLALNGVMLTQNAALPANTVVPFASAAAVSAYFGPTSAEYAQAQIYFQGYDNKTQIPGTLLMAGYFAAAAAAWLRGASMASTTLTQLKAMTGSFTVTIDGVAKTAASVDFSSVTSFSNAATALATALSITPTTNVVWNATTSTFQIFGTTTGTGGNISYATGTLATLLKMTAATGATVSAGAAASTPGPTMDMVVAQTQNWATFMTLFEPVTADKLAFASWCSLQNQRYAYIAWDSDVNASNSPPQASTFGAQVATLQYDGVVCIGGDPLAVPAGSTLAAVVLPIASFILGFVASINFAQTNGRATGAFKSQAGMIPSCLNQQTAANLLANGYSFYGIYATANTNFNFFYNGQLSGKWKWLDSYVDQIYMNSQFQLNLLSLLTSIGSIPYNQDGYTLVKQSLKTTIDQMLNFGAIRSGVTLSSSQAATVNQQAGVKIDTTLQTDGWYLQCKDPGAQVRGNRGTPVINFWYTDGQAIQQFSMASIAVL